MKVGDIKAQEDVIYYYEGLLDFLGDNLPNLEDLVDLYNQSLED